MEKIGDANEIVKLKERIKELETLLALKYSNEEVHADNPERTEAWHKFLRERYDLIPKDPKNLEMIFNLRDLWTAFADGRKSMVKVNQT